VQRVVDVLPAVGPVGDVLGRGQVRCVGELDPEVRGLLVLELVEDLGAELLLGLRVVDGTVWANAAGATVAAEVARSASAVVTAVVALPAILLRRYMEPPCSGVLEAFYERARRRSTSCGPPSTVVGAGQSNKVGSRSRSGQFSVTPRPQW
jgi:hypothetical protein